MIKALFFGCCLLAWGVTSLFAQSGSVASGGTASGTGSSSVSYSVGQAAYSNAIGTNGKITEGIQQPFDIFVNVLENHMDASVSLYPNPTKEFVILNVSNAKVEDITYQLSDMDGKVIATNKLSGNETKIAMTQLASATYFVKVLNLNKESKTFKIIKTQ